MKNATRYRMTVLLPELCSTDVYCSKQTGSSSTKGITHHFFVSGIGQKKTVDAAKICGGAENVVKTETQQTFVNGLLGFIKQAFILRWKRVCIAHNNCMICPSIWATLSTFHSLIYFWVPSSCFLHSDQPLSEGEIIRSAVSASRGRLHYPRRSVGSFTH